MTLPHQWSDDDLQLLEDEIYIMEIKKYRYLIHYLGFREDVQAEWDLLRKIANKYPDYFPADKVNDDAFSWCTNTLLTRCFGIGLDFTMLVPFAD